MIGQCKNDRYGWVHTTTFPSMPPEGLGCVGCIHLVSYHKKHLQPAGYDRKRSWCHSPACRARQAFSDRGADCKYCSDCSRQRNLVSNDKTFQEPFKRQLMISMNMRNVTFFQAFCRYRHLLALGASGRPVSGLLYERFAGHRILMHTYV